MRWDPTQYARYASQRSRPFFDLVGQIGAEQPARVVDLGCGSGELTATLAERWPGASVHGIDSSPEMIERARVHVSPTITFGLGDAAGYRADGVDVLVSNALLQWVPDHLTLLAGWADQLAGDGWLAVQVPDNFDAPSHTLMRELAGSEQWAGRLSGVLRHADAVAPVRHYLDVLADAGLSVNAWQSTYLHLLSGPDPVLEWVRGTGLRPVLAALPEPAAAEFEAQYAQLLRQAYPPADYGTAFPFRRTFVVAHKPARP